MINNEINAIKDRICMTIMPKRIYLFGSFAKDTYNEDSDYDFYVVVPDDAGNKIELSQKAYKSLRGVRKRPVDIVVGFESSFEERANSVSCEPYVVSRRIGKISFPIRLLYRKGFSLFSSIVLKVCRNIFAALENT